MRQSPTQTKVSSKVSYTVQVRCLSLNATGREFQRHGPVTKKLLSPRHVCLGDNRETGTDLSSVLSQSMRLTERILIARPRLHSMQRGNNSNSMHNSLQP